MLAKVTSRQVFGCTSCQRSIAILIDNGATRHQAEKYVAKGTTPSKFSIRKLGKIISEILHEKAARIKLRDVINNGEEIVAKLKRVAK